MKKLILTIILVFSLILAFSQRITIDSIFLYRPSDKATKSFATKGTVIIDMPNVDVIMDSLKIKQKFYVLDVSDILANEDSTVTWYYRAYDVDNYAKYIIYISYLKDIIESVGLTNSRISVMLFPYRTKEDIKTRFGRMEWKK